MKTGFFLLIQIFNQKMQKSLDFGPESNKIKQNQIAGGHPTLNRLSDNYR